MSHWKKYVIGTWSWKRPFYSLLSIYVLLLLVVLFFADHMIFFPPAERYSEDLDGFEYTINSEDEKVAIIYQKARASMPTLLWSHGNAQDISRVQGYLDFLHEKGYGILAYDYPGYGLSEGKPTEAGCYRNIHAAWLYLTDDLGVPEEEICLVGQSVGSGPSIWLAEQNEPAALVLISPFKSINRVPFKINPFPYDRFPNIDRIANVSCPLLVIHGDQDTVIDPSHGADVYAKHRGEKIFHRVEGAGHNDVLGRDEVDVVLFDFLKGLSNQ